MLGDELKRAREEAGLTQEQVSVAAQIDRTYVSILENNKKSPTVEVLFRICEAVGIAASELLERVESGAERSRRKSR